MASDLARCALGPLGDLRNVAPSCACEGTASFHRHWGQIGGDAIFDDRGYEMLAAAARGGPGVFGGLTVGYREDDLPDSAKWVGTAWIGYQFAVNAAHSVQLCPIVNVAKRFVASELALGVVVRSAGGARLIPALAVEADYSRDSLSQQAVSTNASSIWARIQVRLGFLLPNGLAFRPSISIPVWRSEERKAFRLTLLVPVP